MPAGPSATSVATTLRARLLAVLQPPLDLLLARPGPLEWPSDLMPFQVEGLRLLLERDSLLLADEMGLGKTIQALAALRMLTLSGQLASSLVVVPASVFGQWREHFGRWAPELRLSPIRGGADERTAQWRTPAHAHLVSYDTLRADAALARERVWDLVVIDEAQRIKNPQAEVAGVVQGLPRRRAWALTGTPLENRVEDLASILGFVSPRPADAVPGPMRSGIELRDRLRDLQLRRRKQDVLPQLPPRTVTDLTLDMSSAQRVAYERAERDGLLRLDRLGSAVAIANVLELILRLKQICNFDPETGTSVKADDLEGRLESLGAGQRALVFSQFTDGRFGTAAIAGRLARFRPAVYTGELHPQQRDQLVRRFQEGGDHQVMILSLRAGGQGLNLQAASYVFHFDSWWNPAVESQASDRVHRLGQAQPVHVYAYTIEGSVEERIRHVLTEKRALFERVIEGAGIDVGRLSREQLFGLVGRRPPAREPAGRRSG